MVARTRNKMGAKKVRAYVGCQDCKFDSQAEYKYALWLEREKQAGRISDWRHHPGRIPMRGASGRFVCNIEPDFQVWMPDGAVVLHEVKGMATAAWRLKRKFFEDEFGKAAYVVIDAGHVDPPLLFDDRRKRKAERKKAKAAKLPMTKKRGRK